MADNYTKLKDRLSIRKSIDKINHLVGAPLDGLSQYLEIELAKTEYISKLLVLYGSESMDEDC